MRRLWLVTLLGVACVSACGGDPTPARVAQDLRSGDPRAVVKRLWTSGDYDRIVDRIAAGDSDWIALAPQLASGADAGAAESLSIALAQALPKNPGKVLSTLDGSQAALSPRKVCGVPFIEGTITDVNEYIRQAEAGVSGISARGLLDAKSACLAALRNP